MLQKCSMTRILPRTVWSFLRRKLHPARRFIHPSEYIITFQALNEVEVLEVKCCHEKTCGLRGPKFMYSLYICIDKHIFHIVVELN